MSAKLLAPLLAACASLSHAADVTFTDPASAGVDFQIQGEYSGENCGAQVIALGDGKFHLVGWDKGLPGEAPDADRKQDIDAPLQDGSVHFKNAEWDATLKDGGIKGTNKDGASYTLKKVERKSPTLGAKPPAGALVLFDGTNADAWTNGRIDRDGNLQCGVLSKREFGDISLHVEFRIPFKPFARGQARGNSGVYLQDRFEVQVLDSFGLSGENNECGGIYSKQKPKVNMCFPPLSWQTYDIDFTSSKWDANASGKKLQNAVITVQHNGVLIHDHVEVGSSTTAAGRKDGPGPGPIQLQIHGNPVVFRNIWVVEKK